MFDRRVFFGLAIALGSLTAAPAAWACGCQDGGWIGWGGGYADDGGDQGYYAEGEFQDGGPELIARFGPDGRPVTGDFDGGEAEEPGHAPEAAPPEVPPQGEWARLGDRHRVWEARY